MPVSQCSPKWVQPMPTMATRSLMPCEPMSALRVFLAGKESSLPEVVVDAVRVPRTRKVISVRSPMCRSSSVQSVSSQGKRPPPSKSTMAKTTGGLGEYAMRSTVKVAMVASTSAMGAASMSSGGRW